jgi:hypothetical protein
LKNIALVGLMRLWGIMLPGNGVFVHPPLPLETVNNGSLSGVLTLEKLPVRNAIGSIVWTIVAAPEFWRVPCQLPKRKVLFLKIGPPMVAP